MTYGRRLALAGLALAVLAACATVPVSEPRDVDFAPPRVSQAERAAQIMRAATGLGWSMEAQTADQLTMQRQDGGRMARILIRFDRDRFTIERKESQGFGYANGDIAIDYNRWIVSLRDAIVAQSSV